MNWVLYNALKQSQINSTELNLESLKNSNKSDFYNSSDDRLKSLIDSITDRPRSSFDNINWKSIIWEFFKSQKQTIQFRCWHNHIMPSYHIMVSYLDSRARAREGFMSMLMNHSWAQVLMKTSRAGSWRFHEHINNLMQKCICFYIFIFHMSF